MVRRPRVVVEEPQQILLLRRKSIQVSCLALECKGRVIGVTQSLQDRRLPRLPHLGIVGEVFIEKSRRVLQLQDQKHEHHRSGAGAQRVLGQWRALEHPVNQELPVDFLLVQRGKQRVVQRRDTQRADEHDLTEQRCLGNEEELGRALDEGEVGAPPDQIVMALG